MERPEELGRLEISVTPSVGVDADLVSRLADLGVDRIVSLMRGRDRDTLLSFVDALASEVIH